MLRAILAAIGPEASAVCLEDLAARLDVSPGALEGMLQTLVQRGYLVQVPDAASPCDACAWRGGCLVMRTAGRRYARVRGADANRPNDPSPSSS